MARVAVTFAVNNLPTTDSEKSIWSVINHFEDPETDFGDKKVVEEDSKFINDSSALLVFDMPSESLYEGIIMRGCIHAFHGLCICINMLS